MWRSVLPEVRGYLAGMLRSMFTGRPDTILIAEPDRARRQYESRALSHKYRIVQTASIEEAVRTAARHKPEIDLLLTEVRLPDGSGWDLADLLKLDYPDLGVVYMSSAIDGEIRARTRRAVLVMLQSPFNPNRLRKAVGEVLEARRNAQRTRKSATSSPPLSRLLRWVP